MNTITIPNLDEDLHRRLLARAAANHRSLPDEVHCCLRSVIEAEEGLLDSIPAARWSEIERSVCESLHDQGSPLTDGDFQRYRDLARARTGE